MRHRAPEGTAPPGVRQRAGLLGPHSHLHPSHFSASRLAGCQEQAEDVMLNEGPGSLRNRCKTTASRT